MVQIVREKIDIGELLNAVEDHSTGGLVLFLGRVRDHADDRRVIRMEYEGYETMARAELEKIETQVRARWPVRQVAIVHRLGKLELGEVSVAIAVACAHRAQAFEACRYAIDTLKKTIPVWKKEYGPDGAVWVEGQIPDPVATYE